MNAIAPLVESLAWPLTFALALFLLRRQIRGFTQALERKVDESSNVSVETRYMTLKFQADIEGLHADNRALSDALTNTATQSAGESAQDVPTPLMDLADKYMKLRIDDWVERTNAKGDMAARMGAYVLTHHFSKSLLANQSNEGLLLALAEAIRLSPEPGDIKLLLNTYRRLTRLHVRYRYLMAVDRLLERRLVGRHDRRRISGVLRAFERNADEPLNRRLVWTRQLLTQPTERLGV